MNYKAILFDLDNTLVDFTQAEGCSLEHIFNCYFSTEVEKEQFKNHYYPINQKVWSLVESGQLTSTAAGVERFKLLAQSLQVDINYHDVATAYEKGLADYVSWYPGTKEILQNLKNKYQLAIITNGLASVQLKKYSLLNLEQYFECFLVSEIVGIAKPHKDIFIKALDQLSIHTSEALMVGDSLTSDYQGALNANIDFCWINSHQQLLPAHLPQPKFMLESILKLPKLLYF